MFNLSSIELKQVIVIVLLLNMFHVPQVLVLPLNIMHFYETEISEFTWAFLNYA